MSELNKLFSGTAPSAQNISRETMQPVALSVIGSYRINKARLDIKTAAQKVSKKEGERDVLTKQLAEARATIGAVATQLDTLDKVQALLEKTSELARQAVKVQIENIVSQALNVVYGGNHRFIIKLNNGQHGPEAEYWLYDGAVMTRLKRPDYGRGGGKIDVVSTALRLAVIEVEKAEGPIWFDEAGKHVDHDAAPNMAYFIKQYGEDFNRQQFLITHNDALTRIGDTAIHVKKVNDEAVVTAAEGGK